MTDRQAYERGQQDAMRGKHPLFRDIKGYLVPVTDDIMSDDWSEELREHYMYGYDDHYGEVQPL